MPPKRKDATQPHIRPSTTPPRSSSSKSTSSPVKFSPFRLTTRIVRTAICVFALYALYKRYSPQPSESSTSAGLVPEEGRVKYEEIELDQYRRDRVLDAFKVSDTIPTLVIHCTSISLPFLDDSTAISRPPAHNPLSPFAVDESNLCKALQARQSRVHIAGIVARGQSRARSAAVRDGGRNDHETSVFVSSPDKLTNRPKIWARHLIDDLFVMYHSIPILRTNETPSDSTSNLFFSFSGSFMLFLS